MKVIEPSFYIADDINEAEVLKRIEAAGRLCYKSEDKITSDSCRSFVKSIIKRGHESVIEHEKITVVFICDRGISHEIVRHRIASYSMESTRYCNYANEKFGNELTFIRPYFWDTDSELYRLWEEQMRSAESAYLKMIEMGATPQEARCILPTSLKTEIATTMNMRSWRHFLTLRTNTASHPQMREIAIPLLAKFKEILPAIFDDIEVV
jgi:thymidylate synthase (FAD)